MQFTIDIKLNDCFYTPVNTPNLQIYILKKLSCSLAALNRMHGGDTTHTMHRPHPIQTHSHS